MRFDHLLLALFLLLLLPIVLLFLGAFWLPLLLFVVVVVGLSLWAVRHYYLDYLDEPDERRSRG